MSLVDSSASPSGNGANGHTTSAFPSIEPTLVVEHLASVLEITLGATRRELENVDSLLSKAKYSDTVQRCSRFGSESQAVLYVQKDVASQGQGDGGDELGKELGDAAFQIDVC